MVKQKHFFVKTQSFVLVSHMANKDVRDYFVRVEQLSHDSGDADALRRHYSLVLAINGL